MVELVLLVVLGLAAFGILWVSSTLWRDPSAKLYAESKTLHETEHDLRVLTPEQRPPIDRSGYDEHGRVLLEAGFRFLGDIEDVTSVFPDNRTYAAAYVSDDGLVVCETWRLRGQPQTADFGTALQDGRFLQTSSVENNRLAPPPSALREIHPFATPLATLHERHRARLILLESDQPAARAAVIGDVEALLEVHRRYLRAVSEYRRSVGFLTLEELLSMAQNDRERRVARHLWKGIQRRWRRDRRR